VGLETEQAYFYKRNQGEGPDKAGSSPSQGGDPAFIIDTAVEDAENNIIHGVKVSFGDLVCSSSVLRVFLLISIVPPINSMLTATAACHLHRWATCVLMPGKERKLGSIRQDHRL
jgi:hypothetical protein